MNLIKEAIINWGDLFWLRTYINFVGKPEIEFNERPGSIFYSITGSVRVFVKKKLIEYRDYSGTCIYRVKYDPANDSILLSRGTYKKYMKGADFESEEFLTIIRAFREDAVAEAEKVLIDI